MNIGEIAAPIHNSADRTDSGHRIVFFIRAIFRESIMLRVGIDPEIHPKECIDNFDRYSRIPMMEYRKLVHDIQIECLQKISNRFIYNSIDENLNDSWKLPYVRIQNKAREQILALSDDDIIIPLDDDDWLSPDVRFLDFKPNYLTMWNTFSMSPNSGLPFFHPKNENLPIELDETNTVLAKNLLSNCGAFCASIVKRIINCDVKKSNQLLLRHTLPRVIIREEPFKLWGIQEKIHDGYLSVYVRHAGNITSFTRKGDDVGDFYSKNIEAYKNKKYAAADNLPSEYAWSQQYYKKLENLNQML